MKIAIAADDGAGKGMVSDRGGRAPHYLLYDAEGSFLESLANPFAIGGGGAGFAVAKMLADKGVGVLVAGTIGENMTGALRERGIRHIGMNGAISDALRAVPGLE